MSRIETFPGGAPTQRAWLDGVRHDLSAPANAILGFSRILLESGNLVDVEQQEGVQGIRDAGHGLIGLLDEAKMSDSGEPLSALELRRLRHDFLNELNIVEGYVELILDEPESQTHLIADDLGKIQRAAERARAVLESIARWTAQKAEDDAEVKQAHRGAEAYRRAMSSLDGRGPVSSDSTQGANLLVVDDDESNRDLLERRLGTLGYTVSLARDGQDAMNQLAQGDFDLVLLDIIMPAMNGYEVLAAMKDDERLRHVPVIIVTAFEDTDSVVRCIQMGADEYLPKTFNPVLLQARISACLEKKRYRDREQQMLEQLNQEQARAEALLLNILPRSIAAKLKSGAHQIATTYDDATVLFADLVNFTAFSSTVGADIVVQRLNEVFIAFDAIVEARGLEKIKTVGDAYMLAGGVPEARLDHAAAVVEAALDMLAALERLSARGNFPNQLRIGIHSGPLVAGVIGRSKFSYDLWGDTVNTASRMEHLSQPGRIHISSETFQRCGNQFRCVPRGAVEVKGKGLMNTYFLEGRR